MSSRLTIRDRWTFFLATGLLAVFVIFFGIAFFHGLFADPPDYSGAEKVSAYLGLIPGAVLAYYFQQGRVQQEQVEVREPEKLL